MKREEIYTCSICGKDITGEHVIIKTRRKTELHIHYECMPVRRKEDGVKTV